MYFVKAKIVTYMFVYVFKRINMKKKNIFGLQNGGKIGPYAHTPFNFLNLTEIFLYWKDYKSRK